MMAVQIVAFHQAKQGSMPGEWEDGVGFDPGDASTARNPRCVVVDGATEAYDSIRWVGQLVESFLGLDPGGRPSLDEPAMDSWFGDMQQQWVDRAPAAFSSIFEERKFLEQGSFATFLGCELAVDRETPVWHAAALGDAVLFHLRDGQLVQQFPALSADEFGIDPPGISTQPSMRNSMRAGLEFAAGTLAAHDQLLMCTDALAAWAVTSAGNPDGSPWVTLSAISHPQSFSAFAEAELLSGRLKNDDLTLLRVSVSPAPANELLVCQS